MGTIDSDLGLGIRLSREEENDEERKNN